MNGRIQKKAENPFHVIRSAIIVYWVEMSFTFVAIREHIKTEAKESLHACILGSVISFSILNTVIFGM